ncbi:Stress response protein NhaX [Mizuhopecten yessoensis]|uniref:Stress response protein NhaX n=1 Tax=Mizuhopecten yessoensis TaxID=6573 RepID=A0A210QAT9_MIZYE|nr:Stress response protein NhaX [Mizuhopecten yessoensis]
MIFEDSDKEGGLKTDEEEGTRLKAKLDSYQQLLTEFKLMGEVKPVSDKTPGKAIISAIEELNADVLVTGSRGHGRIRRAVLGSVSEYLLHRARIPVVICKESSSDV